MPTRGVRWEMGLGTWTEWKSIAEKRFELHAQRTSTAVDRGMHPRKSRIPHSKSVLWYMTVFPHLPPIVTENAITTLVWVCGITSGEWLRARNTILSTADNPSKINRSGGPRRGYAYHDDCGQYEPIICTQFSVDGDTLSDIYFWTPNGKLALALRSTCTSFTRLNTLAICLRRTVEYYSGSPQCLLSPSISPYVRSRRRTSTAVRCQTRSNKIPKFSPEHALPPRTFLKPFAATMYFVVGTPCHRRQKYTSETNWK